MLLLACDLDYQFRRWQLREKAGPVSSLNKTHVFQNQHPGVVQVAAPARSAMGPVRSRLAFFSFIGVQVRLVRLFVVLREVVRPVHDVEHPKGAREEDSGNRNEIVKLVYVSSVYPILSTLHGTPVV